MLPKEDAPYRSPPGISPELDAGADAPTHQFVSLAVEKLAGTAPHELHHVSWGEHAPAAQHLIDHD